jgi:hypothetical protein
VRRTTALIAAACLALALPPASAQAASPAAVDDPSTVIAEDGGLVSIDVLANDAAGDGGPLSVASVTQPATGTAQVAPGGAAVTFEPAPNANGVVTFTYVASDGTTFTGPATVTVTITPVNDPPVAHDDPSVACTDATWAARGFPIPEDFWSAAAGAGYEAWFPFFGHCALLANDTDPDGDSLTYEIVTNPGHGRVWKIDEEWFAYDADQDYSTLPGDQPTGEWVSDSFTYRAFDGQAYSDPATMRIWVAPVNDPPTYTPGPGTIEVNEDNGPYSVPWATDVSPGPGASEAGQAVEFEVTDLDVTGVPNLFSVPPAVDGQGVLTFTPGPDQFGLARVTVRPKDDGGLEEYLGGNGESPPPNDTGVESTFDIVVWPVPDATIARDDSFEIERDSGPVELDVLANDSDADGDVLAVAYTDPASLGTPQTHLNGAELVYTPFPNVTGVDTFTYSTTTGATATVTVTISGPNRAPTAVDDTLVVEQGGSAALDPRANDADLDGDALTVVSVGGAAHGTATITGGGTGVAYTPVHGFRGDDAFSYTVSDGNGADATASIAVTVEPDRTPPVLSDLAESFPAQVTGSTVAMRLTWVGFDPGSRITEYRLLVSVGGGPSRPVALLTPTSVSAVRAVAPWSTYQFSVSATDATGNTGPFVPWPALSIAKYDEGTALATWTGSWLTSARTYYSGGRTRYTTAANRRVRLAFTGRDVAWVATRGPSGGRAQVLADGVVVAVVDLRATSTQGRRVVFSRHFATRAAHTLEIVTLGGGRVDVDAFLVAR